MNRSRRDMLVGAAGLTLAAAHSEAAVSEIPLTDDPTRGDWARYDADNFGPPASRGAKRDFQFPRNADDLAGGYGIDLSHHYAGDVPWSALAGTKVSYVYAKCSQSDHAFDNRFEEFWKGARSVKMPVGAYHFLTAGVSGKLQAAYFLQRLSMVGGLKAGDLQPVLDLEWDPLGPDFKRVVVGHDKQGKPIYKDYWDEAQNKARIVTAVADFAQTVRASSPAIRPIIYTNRSWWNAHVPSGTIFEGCSVWISDYRNASFQQGTPLSVNQHKYYLWQFTDGGTVKVGIKTYGPFDSNKLVNGGMEHICIT